MSGTSLQATRPCKTPANRLIQLVKSAVRHWFAILGSPGRCRY
jgi:hypothetical protein